jgi:hypothetical protein
MKKQCEHQWVMYGNDYGYGKTCMVCGEEQTSTMPFGFDLLPENIRWGIPLVIGIVMCIVVFVMVWF